MKCLNITVPCFFHTGVGVGVGGQVAKLTCGPFWCDLPVSPGNVFSMCHCYFCLPPLYHGCCWKPVSMSAESQHHASSWGGRKQCFLAAHCYFFTLWYVVPKYYYTQAHYRWMSCVQSCRSHTLRETLKLISKIKLHQNITSCLPAHLHFTVRWQMTVLWMIWPILWPPECVFQIQDSNFWRNYSSGNIFFLELRDFLFFWFSMTHIQNSWSVPAPLYLPKKERLKIGCMPQLLRYSGSGQSLPPSPL